MGTDNRRAGGFTGEEFVNLAGSAVPDSNDIAVVVHVQDEVAAHDAEPDDADVRCAVFMIVAHIGTSVRSEDDSLLSAAHRPDLSSKATVGRPTHFENFPAPAVLFSTFAQVGHSSHLLLVWWCE